MWIFPVAIHVAHAPGLTRVDPRIARSSCDKTQILIQVCNRLTGAWCPNAIGRKANPVPVVGFDGRPGIKVYAAVGAYAQIIDTTHRSGDTTRNRSCKRDVDTRSLWWNLFLA